MVVFLLVLASKWLHHQWLWSISVEEANNNSLPHARFVSGHHYFNQMKSLRASTLLENLQSFLNRIAQIMALLLRVIDAVTLVNCKNIPTVFFFVPSKQCYSFRFSRLTIEDSEKIQDRQQRFIIGYESFARLFGASGDQLQDFQRWTNDVRIACVQRSFKKTTTF